MVIPPKCGTGVRLKNDIPKLYKACSWSLCLHGMLCQLLPEGVSVGLANWKFFIDDTYTYLHVDMLEQLVNCFLKAPEGACGNILIWTSGKYFTASK